MDAVRGRIGALCSQLERWGTLSEIIRDGGAGAELDELTHALESGIKLDQDRATELLDAVDAACAKRGLAGLTTRAFRALPPGFDAPKTAAWVCPLRSCDRVVLPEEAAAPLCAATGGRPMAHFQIS